MVETVISGGQTGADQAGLRAGKELGLNTGGLAPKGWKTEAGPAPWLEEYGLVESTEEDYLYRTEDNVKVSDATVIFGRRSQGSNRTEEFCRIHNKPFVWINFPVVPDLRAELSTRGFKLWVIRHNVTILNVAGNRESKNPGIGDFTYNFLIRALGK